MARIDLSFRRYVETQRGSDAAQVRAGAAYAYVGDLKIRRTLDRLKPVTLAAQATVRLWREAARGELLQGAARTSPRVHPRTDRVVDACARALGITRPPAFVSETLLDEAAALGTRDDALLLVGARLESRLDDRALAFVVGRLCGHLHNEHVLYLTTHRHLRHWAGRFARWLVAPAARALESWLRRADITCDRAGLLAVRDLGVAERTLVEVGLGARDPAPGVPVDVDELLRQLEGGAAPTGRFAVPDAAVLGQRVRALRLFAESAYYRSAIGLSGGLVHEECDARVAEIIGVIA